MSSLTFPLTVVEAPGIPHPASSAARRAFNAEVKRQGGLWIERMTSLREVIDQVALQAPGTHVLVFGADSDPIDGLLEALDLAAFRFPLADVLYGDRVELSSPYEDRVMLPRWSPTRLEYENYIGETFLVRTSFLVSLDTTDAWDSWSLLRQSGRVGAVVAHVREVWTQGPVSEARPALTRKANNKPRLAKKSTAQPRYDLITLTAGSSDPEIGHGTPFITQHLEAVHDEAGSLTGKHIVVIGHECAPEVVRILKKSHTITLVNLPGAFNFAHRANEARRHSQAEILVFINDDFVPTRKDWLELLLEPLADPRVGATGATMLYADDRIQHAGVGVVGVNFDHPFAGEHSGDDRLAGLVSINREVDAVTGACLAIRATVFDEIGGFFEGFPFNYNDVDICLKLRTAGHLVVHVGTPLGRHYESQTRPAVLLEEEFALLNQRWPLRPLFSDYPYHVPPAREENKSSMRVDSSSS